MQNIHLLPTDKPSRLAILNSGKLNLGARFISFSNSKAQRIYITNDEKPKDGDWCFNPKTNKTTKVGHHGHYGYSSKKIILTTDPDLISEGVQAIDGDFLEWFVKNSSCEYVEVKKGKLQTNDDGQRYGFPDMSLYEIIIPQEEAKQECIHQPRAREYYRAGCYKCFNCNKIIVEHNNIEQQKTLEELKQDIIQLIENRILSEYKKHSLSLPDEWAKIAAYKIYKSISDKM
jgi:hypothetical protein